MYIFVLFCCIVSANAQVKSGVQKGDLKIGEQTELIYEVNVFSKSLKVDAKPFKKIIPALRFSAERSYENPDSIEIEIIQEFKQRTQTKAGETNWKGSYTITVWDTGYFVIPPFEAKSGDSSIQFSPILIHVTAPTEIQGKELYDIKEEFFEIPFDWGDWMKQYGYWILGGLVLALGIFAYFFFKRKRKTHAEDTRSLEEKTLLAIESLYASGMWKKDNSKAYYSELSFILRSYLSARFSLNLLERTTFETNFLLKQKGVHESSLSAIRSVLDQSDLVKFAKLNPTETDIEESTERTKTIVIETTKLLQKDA